MKKNRTEFEAVVTAGVLVIMLGLVFVGVLSRYVFHFSISFTEELVCAMFVMLGTVGSALASKRRSLYTLDLVTGMMKPKMQLCFSIFTTALTTIAAAILIYCSFSMIQTQMTMGSVTVALHLPAWLYTTFVPFGLALVVFRNIQNIVQDVKALKALKKEGDAQ